MLEIIVEPSEFFDSDRNEFHSTNGGCLRLEHSLLSVKKWESKWHIPFLDKTEKTKEQTIDYIRCMTLNTISDPYIYYFISPESLQRISDYIADPMTATWFSKSDENRGGIRRGEKITSEIIYYWMITLQIPMECQKWHLNQLLTLIKVVNIKNAPKKNKSRKETIKDYAALNRERLAKYNTTG